VTSEGPIDTRYHAAAAGDVAILWVFGAGGGFFGPAGGLYERLGSRFADEGVASLQVAYRRPGALTHCVLDVLVAVGFLEQFGRARVILVGHSFGGAVVITAGAQSPNVIGVAALSSQSYGAFGVSEISPRPLLLMHGEADEVLPDTTSRNLYRHAAEPKQLILYPGCSHGLDQCRDELDRDLTAWLRAVVSGQRPGSTS
jgi:alpha-beta hydrolase superfamily lysophospholipase